MRFSALLSQSILIYLVCTVTRAGDSTLSKVSIAANGRSFQVSEDKPFVPFGVTYYRPGTGWAPQVWKEFDAAATRRDFKVMKEAGVNCVRVFLSYGSFCNAPGTLDEGGIAKFDQFLEIAEAAGVYVHPTGPDHWEGTPEWASVDRIADEQTLAGLEAFWKAFAARYRNRSVIFAYDLRNEPEVLWDTPPMRAKWKTWLTKKYGASSAIASAWKVEAVSENALVPPQSGKSSDAELLDYQLFREQLADDWTRRQTEAIKNADPKALVTVGLIQWSIPSCLPRPEHYSAFRPERQAKFLDFMEVHFYPLDHGAYEYHDAESEGRNLAYLESVVREAARPGKALVLAEFGWYGGGKPKFDNGRHSFATEEQQARWCRKVVEATSGIATGWLNWGFYDQPEATDCSEFTGLYTADGKPKAWGRQFRELSAKLSVSPLPQSSISARPKLDWNRAILSANEGNHYRDQYYGAWKTLSPVEPPAASAR